MGPSETCCGRNRCENEMSVAGFMLCLLPRVGSRLSKLEKSVLGAQPKTTTTMETIQRVGWCKCGDRALKVNEIKNHKYDGDDDDFPSEGLH